MQIILAIEVGEAGAR